MLRSATAGVLVAAVILGCAQPQRQQAQEERSKAALPAATPQPVETPGTFKGAWRISAWHPRRVGTAGIEDVQPFLGRLLSLDESAVRLGDEVCEGSVQTVEQKADFWDRVERCQTEYHPEWDCRSIGEDGDIFLKCLDGNAPAAPPQRLQGLTCEASGIATSELVLLSDDHMVAVLADGAGFLCLGRESPSH